MRSCAIIGFWLKMSHIKVTCNSLFFYFLFFCGLVFFFFFEFEGTQNLHKHQILCVELNVASISIHWMCAVNLSLACFDAQLFFFLSTRSYLMHCVCVWHRHKPDILYYVMLYAGFFVSLVSRDIFFFFFEVTATHFSIYAPFNIIPYPNDMQVFPLLSLFFCFSLSLSFGGSTNFAYLRCARNFL